MKEQNVKSRGWNGIVYPDSAPQNWRELIDELHIQWAESPLHEHDKNADGSLKKPHFHVTLVWDGPTTFTNACAIFKDLLNSVHPQATQSIRGSIRYMAHLDNPEKYRYNEHDIVGHGGIDLEELLRPTTAYEQSTLKQIVLYIRENNITEFSDFAMICLGEKEEWFYLLTSRHTVFIRELIKSQRFKSAQSQ